LPWAAMDFAPLGLKIKDV